MFGGYSQAVFNNTTETNKEENSDFTNWKNKYSWWHYQQIKPFTFLASLQPN
jgi:hypothetical protein